MEAIAKAHGRRPLEPLYSTFMKIQFLRMEAEIWLNEEKAR